MALDNVDKKDIYVAHHIGDPGQNCAQLMVVQCNPNFKECILANTKNLAGIKNADDKAYYVNQQVPEDRIADRKEVSHKIKRIKEGNVGKMPNLQTKFFFKNKKLHINGAVYQKQVNPPAVGELFVEKAEQDKTEKIKLWYLSLRRGRDQSSQLLQ